MVDAILGALGLPDIGQIFPDSDPRWKGAASSVFVEEAVSLFCLILVFFLLVLFESFFIDLKACYHLKFYCSSFEFVFRLVLFKRISVVLRRGFI